MVVVGDDFHGGETLQFAELEGFSVLSPNVLNLSQAFQVVHQVQHLFVFLVGVEWNDGDAVVNLKGEGEDWVVDNDQVTEVSVSEYPKVFHVVAFLGLHAVVAVETVLEELVLRVEVVQDGICIGLVWCSEDYDLEIVLRLLEAFVDVWSDVDSSLLS